MRVIRVAGLSSAIAVALIMGAFSIARAGDGPLERGLHHLRSGDQEMAARYLLQYLDEETDVAMRATVEQTLLAMNRPLSPEAGQVVAATLEESIRAHLAFKRRLALDWRNRTFVPFP